MPNPGDILEIVQNGMFLDSIPMLNVYRYRYEGPGTISAAQVLIDLKATTDDIYGQADDFLSNQHFLNPPTIKEVYPNPVIYGNTLTIRRAGIITTSDTLPLGCCVRAKLYSGLSRIRGSHWMAGLPKNLHDGGTLTSTALTRVQEWASTLVTLRVVSGRTYRPGSWQNSAHIFTPWTTALIDPHICYLLRRVPRG